MSIVAKRDEEVGENGGEEAIGMEKEGRFELVSCFGSEIILT